MNIIILNYSPHGNQADRTAIRLLIEVAEERGHRCREVSLGAVPWRCSPNAPLQEPLLEAEVVIPRFDVRSAAELEWVLTVLDGLEGEGLRLSVESRAIRNAEDKGRTAMLFARHAIPTPRSAVVGVIADEEMPARCEAEVAAVGGYPVVVKHPYGWGGMGVMKVASTDLFRPLLDFLLQVGYRGGLLIQEFVPHDRSLSAAVVDGEIVRTAAKIPGRDFRSNVRAGGVEIDAELLPGERELARHAAQVFGISGCTVDWVRSPRGPLLLEVNACPGLCPPGDLPVARAIFAHLERLVPLPIGPAR